MEVAARNLANKALITLKEMFKGQFSDAVISGPEAVPEQEAEAVSEQEAEAPSEQEAEGPTPAQLEELYRANGVPTQPAQVQEDPKTLVLSLTLTPNPNP